MAARIGRNKNTNNEADVDSAVALNATTSTAVLSSNSERIYIAIAVTGGDAWVKLQPAAMDNDKKGIPICDGQTYELPTDNMYTGEISAIAVSGTPNAYPTEF